MLHVEEGSSYVRARLKICGIVQGVFFRSSMRRKAYELGVTGWVMNKIDGSVEAEVEGPKEAVEEIIAWAKVGPPAAVVERVDVEWLPYEGKYKDFRIRYW
ncbi:MAG: acylphosphatase [Desulfurococcales archaeon]|nr:acylphosphatase [Desulfurococcales archaeon]